MASWASAEKKTPHVIAAIEAQLKYDVAGDPITGIRWTHRTTASIAANSPLSIFRSAARTVARILKVHYRLRVNHKRVSAGSGPDRDQQFTFASQRVASRGRMASASICQKARWELQEPRHDGAKTPQAVNDPTFRSPAIPYGISCTANRGFVVVRHLPSFWRVSLRSDNPTSLDNLVRWCSAKAASATPVP